MILKLCFNLDSFSLRFISSTVEQFTPTDGWPIGLFECDSFSYFSFVQLSTNQLWNFLLIAELLNFIVRMQDFPQRCRLVQFEYFVIFRGFATFVSSVNKFSNFFGFEFYLPLFCWLYFWAALHSHIVHWFVTSGVTLVVGWAGTVILFCDVGLWVGIFLPSLVGTVTWIGTSGGCYFDFMHCDVFCKFRTLGGQFYWLWFFHDVLHMFNAVVYFLDK